jgi:hypothetical protein
MEPARRIGLRLTPYQGVVVPLPLSRRELAGLESNPRPVTVKAAGALPTEQPAIRALPQGRTGQAALTRGTRTPVRRASCPRRDSNAHCRSPRDRDSCRWSTRTWSRHLVSNRASCLTGAGPQAVRGGKAGHPGFEPGNSGSRARRICQFSQWPSSAEGAIRTHMPRGLSSRGLPVAVTPAWCAARDSNPDRDTG